jgi:ankyrin repeat protein
MGGMRPAALLALLVLGVSSAASAQDVSAAAARGAATRALPLLQTSAVTFVEARSCMSCHHNALAVLTLRQAHARGLPVDTPALDQIEARTLATLRGPAALDEAIQGVHLSDPTPNDTYLLWAADAARVVPDLTTSVVARRIARWRRGDHWETSDFRPPHSSSAFTATATAIRALRRYMPSSLATERDAAVRDGREWLTATPPRSTEDAAFRLFGLVWADAPATVRSAAVDDLARRQMRSGGWGQLPGDAADAYATGEALVALQEAGIPTRDPRIQRGLRYLISTQARDGTWRVPSRMISPATVSPPYFETGFPYGKDEFLSYAGSCWAVMALLAAVPETDGKSVLAGSMGPGLRQDSDGAGALPWVTAALFGTTGELTAHLDDGLDPNATTPHGTTLLMAAVTEPEKVQLLLARGADPAPRSAAGVDALTVAATYRGTAASAAHLLKAGAAADPPADRRPRHTPLAYAAMHGDREMVRRLLTAGAKGASEALPEAITFGHPDVAKLLIEAGARVQVAEPSGITLLHWTVITGRTAVIPLLVEAGADVDAVDSFEFTPLMYAVTLARGDATAVEALLAAGANRSIRNAAGRTPLQQALRLGDDVTVRALRRPRR